MPFKDLEKRRKYRREWYSKNKQSEKAHVKRRKLNLRKWFQEYKKNNSCSKCGENHISTLEFHHKFKNKEMEIGKMVSEGYSIIKIKKEIDKCIVLCANCHRKIHYLKRDKF